MLETIQPSTKEIQYPQTCDRCKDNRQTKVYGEGNLFSSLIDRIVSLVHYIEKGCQRSQPIDKNRIKLLKIDEVKATSVNCETQSVVIPHLNHSPCVLGETSEQLLGLFEKNLGLEGAAPWRALLNQCCRIHGSDKLQSMHQDADGTYTVRLSEPLRIWMYSTDDKNRVDPLGGIVLMLGANQYQPLGREKLSDNQMKFQLLENEIRFLGGAEIFVKTPAWARPLTLYQMQEYDYTDVTGYKVNQERATIRAQYETFIITAHKDREKGLNHLTKTWEGHSLTHPTEVLPLCPPDQITATAQACIQKHLNDDFAHPAMRV